MLTVLDVALFITTVAFLSLTVGVDIYQKIKDVSRDGWSSIMHNDKCEGDTMSDSESRSNGGLGAAWKAAAVEATVPPTAGEILAQLIAYAEQQKAEADEDKRKFNEHRTYYQVMMYHNFNGKSSAFDSLLREHRRLADAKDASSQELWITTS